MKAISVRQPHASRIRERLKSLEIRSRRIHYRGPLLICSSLHVPDAPHRHLPRGVALCIVDVVDCRPMTKADEASAMTEFVPNHFAWALANVREVEPFAVKGALGFFNVELPTDRLTSGCVGH